VSYGDTCGISLKVFHRDGCTEITRPPADELGPVWNVAPQTQKRDHLPGTGRSRINEIQGVGNQPGSAREGGSNQKAFRTKYVENQDAGIDIMGNFSIIVPQKPLYNIG